MAENGGPVTLLIGRADGSGPVPVVSRTPFPGPAEAVAASRAHGPASGKTILLGDGRHYLDEPLRLDARDSGLTIAAAPGTAPVLVGGRPVAGWRSDGDGLWAADAPGVREGTCDVRMLVVDGRMRPRARLPRDGFFEHRSGWAILWMSTTGGGWQRKPTIEELTTMYCDPGDPVFGVDIRNAELTVYHKWDESVVGVAGVDQASGAVRFSTPAGHPPGAFGVHRYVVWNVREGMAEPGRWYLDRGRGTIVYRPLPGEDIAALDVLAPTVESLIRIEGTESAPVRGLSVRDLALTVTTTPLTAGGFGARAFDGAVSASFAHDSVLSGLRIFNVAGQGIKEAGSRGLTVERCDIHDTGACGIVAGDGRKTVRDNVIRRVGAVYPSAIGVSCDGARGGEGTLVVHNTIEETPYSAVVCGGDNHAIESNLIRRAMNELHDGAAVYITFCRNVAVRGNVVRDLVSGDTSAYYLDEQAEECLVEGNVSVNVERPSHNHMARNNRIAGNTFVNGGSLRLTFPRSAGYVFEGNTLRAGGPIRFVPPEAIVRMEGNTLFSAEGIVEGASGGNSYDDPGVEVGGTVAPGPVPGASAG